MTTECWTVGKRLLSLVSALVKKVNGDDLMPSNSASERVLRRPAKDVTALSGGQLFALY